MKISRRFSFLVLTFCFTLFTQPTLALDKAEETPLQAATRVQQQYDDLQSLTFTFIQNTRGSLSGRPKRATGKAYFVKNGQTGKMRWDYFSPDEQVILSDGFTLKMYFAKLNQMILTSADSLQEDITYAFFSGTGNILNDFEILPPDTKYTSTDEAASSLASIKMVPKSTQSQVKSIHLWISPSSLIRRIEIEDHFETLTFLNLSDLKVDQLKIDDMAFMDSLFSFTPPEGTEIIQQ